MVLHEKIEKDGHEDCPCQWMGRHEVKGEIGGCDEYEALDEAEPAAESGMSMDSDAYWLVI